MTVLAVLMTASAGRRSVAGAAGIAAVGASVLLAGMLFRWPFPAYDGVSLAAAMVVAAAGVCGMAMGRREDTRLIALLLTGSALLPFLIRFLR